MSIYEKVTNHIIEAIEKGAGDFKMPWHNKGASAGFPINATTNKCYSGSNVLTLWIERQAKGYTSDKWGTYKQWQAMGANVRKGEKSVLGVYWNLTDKTTKNEQGEDETEKRIFASPFYLFNADQVEGYTAQDIEPTPNKVEPVAMADNLIKKVPVIINHGGARAFYRPSTDEITMPDQWRFIGTETSTATEAYYSTLLHEVSHWTGSETRLNRTKGKRFGDNDYSFEELVAELSAAFLCASLGISNQPRLDHAQYIENWLKGLKNDSRAIFSAASLAKKASDYILNHQS